MQLLPHPNLFTSRPLVKFKNLASALFKNETPCSYSVTLIMQLPFSWKCSSQIPLSETGLLRISSNYSVPFIYIPFTAFHDIYFSTQES